jgi:hypothetical protein
MEQQRILNQPENTDDYTSLLPEIAELLNVTISTLEHYPTDMKMLICQTYINNYPLDSNDTKQALLNVINLDKDELQIKQPDVITNDSPQALQEQKDVEHRQTAPSNVHKKENKSYLISRREILHNAKTISDSSSRKEIREKHTEQIVKSTTTTS